jgi:hypothetical protein
MATLLISLGLLFAGACSPASAVQTSTDNNTGVWAGHAEKVELIYFHRTLR